MFKRAANFDDLDQLLESGWLVGLDVNTRVLNGSAGFSLHLVVIFDTNEAIYMLQDPGLPLVSDRKVSREILDTSLSYGGRENMVG